ncbi:UDP-glucose 4-epimerase [Archaeoglobus sulfaticallidus PM70-1]|uniref:UDP-glucose 4-epimerase n=1 Tax=Archaeoglobus sulfaticallidus PM70-1 TaxID=387631 RepID=N0BN54_9EURY|nr:NAD(P)-dependent oxidoreductase [Archaeoglobus sulfaticallidus]AGK62031.1 UDP-glucose 4-epimerase [Archaeoglobus sulfaticallidus PM70-1]
MRIGVTGAGGYVGAGLCSKLMEKHEVVMLDNFYKAQIGSIGGKKIIWADIRDRAEMESLLRDCDVIVHLAAISGVAECDEMPERAYDVNIIGTENICWICRKYGIDMIFPSSMAVVGNPVEIPITPRHPRNPLNMYGFTKWVNEENIRAFSKNSFNALIFMKTNLYGEYEVDGNRISKNTVINIFANKAKRNENLTVHKPGTQTRDFIHVLDVIDAYLLAIENMPEGFNIVTLAGGECLSVLDIANLVQKYSDVGIDLVENPRKKETHAPNFEVDTSEIKELIGFESKRKVEEEVRKLLGI